MEDYEVFIEDYKEEITKKELIIIINERLSRRWSSAEMESGVEIDVEDEWKRILREDGSILWDYQKLGWKAMQYQRQRNDGTVREWLSFKNPNFLKRR